MSDAGSVRPTVGLVAAQDDGRVAAALGNRVDLVAVPLEPAEIAATRVAALVVVEEGLPAPVLQVVRDGDTPALVLAPASSARAWHRVLRKGVHDVVWLPADDAEIRARLLGIVARQGAWNRVTSSLCREIAHDLRSPLQALHFTVAALQHDDAVAPEFSEDVDALLEATDVAGLLLDGIGNLGRFAAHVPTDGAVGDLTAVVKKVASRRAFGGAVTVESGEPLPVKVPADALEGCVQDVLRVAWVRAAGRRQVRVSCMRFGDVGVVSTQSRGYDAFLAHADSLLWRERPVLLRRQRVPMPLAGLAYAREVATAVGGNLSASREGDELRLELRLPLV